MNSTLIFIIHCNGVYSLQWFFGQLSFMMLKVAQRKTYLPWFSYYLQLGSYSLYLLVAYGKIIQKRLDSGLMQFVPDNVMAAAQSLEQNILAKISWKDL